MNLRVRMVVSVAVITGVSLVSPRVDAAVAGGDVPGAERAPSPCGEPAATHPTVC